jgi:hypothetical protein
VPRSFFFLKSSWGKSHQEIRGYGGDLELCECAMTNLLAEKMWARLHSHVFLRKRSSSITLGAEHTAEQFGIEIVLFRALATLRGIN